MQEAYASWANTVEQEVADMTGTELGKYKGKRGNFPKLQEVSIVHSRRESTPVQLIAHAWALAEAWCRRIHTHRHNLVQHEQSAVAAVIAEAARHDEDLLRVLETLCTAPQGRQEAHCRRRRAC